MFDPVSLGAYIWKYNNLAKEKYSRSEIKTYSLYYEQLLTDPKKILFPIIKDFGLYWEDVILRHNSVHAGKIYAGNTVGDRAVDISRKTPRLNLSDDEIENIKAILQEKY